MLYRTNKQLSTPNKIYDLYILEYMKHLYSPPFWVLISLMNLHFLKESINKFYKYWKWVAVQIIIFAMCPFSWTVGSFWNWGRQKTAKPMIPSLIDTGNCFEQFLLCSKFVKDFFLVYKHEIATFDTNSLHTLGNWPFFCYTELVCSTEYTIVDRKSFWTFSAWKTHFWSWLTCIK